MEQKLWIYNMHERVEKIKQATAKQTAQGIEVRTFPYADVCDDYGILEAAREMNAFRAWKRWDTGGWNELKGVMQRNRERMSTKDLSKITKNRDRLRAPCLVQASLS